MSRSSSSKCVTRCASARLFAPILVFGLALFAGAAAVTAAQGPNADQLRREGRACEQPDGFIRALSPDAQADVERINAQRRQVYQQRAAQERVDLAAVGVLYAEEIRRQPDYRACP